ncbi:LOW QUALITY PROTEIN: beta-1,3-galactosyl-O-glycosyl-glycoprotein beta-1,6-N-acetylglucosaminyltransferase-like [Liolophura sinensis]|uniref:LOW QUALITY PROTEIN: beta-1,3-galactosyl-O-glycosyl-glycoprotein beta-1,6-N-acetylglucosaminyltransferase-like n=1 Tax=Liolophura sinensis TaxID=3198878 RepID=UPI0031587882
MMSWRRPLLISLSILLLFEAFGFLLMFESSQRLVLQAMRPLSFHRLKFSLWETYPNPMVLRSNATGHNLPLSTTPGGHLATGHATHEVPGHWVSKMASARLLVSKVNCQALIRGDKHEQSKTEDLMRNENRKPLNGEDYFNICKNCSEFISARGYITIPLSAEEMNFPIAYSILMYKDSEQAERLLRAIYQPQNYYCIHVDRKSEGSIKRGMEAVAKCFDNVFLVEKPVAVVWGKFTVLEAELLCLKELWAYQKWKYFINLTGQEFPLKTNFELVKILKAYNGSNNLEGTRGRANTDRWKNAGPPPHGIIPTKGAVHITASRGYVDFLLHNQTALDFLEWVKKTRVPDETFFASLNHNPFLEVPGSYKGTPESNFENYQFLTRFKIWAGTKLWKLCTGKFTRGICIFGVKDLPVLTSQRHLFANKFHWDYQPYVLDCLEEWHFNKTIDQAVHKSNFDVSFYKNMSFVKNKVT